MKKLRMMLRSGTIDKKTFERMRNRIKEEIIFAEELEGLHTLLHDKIIDQGTYVQLRELLEKAFRQRLKSLVVEVQRTVLFLRFSEFFHCRARMQ